MNFFTRIFFSYFPLINNYSLLRNGDIQNHGIRRDKLVCLASLMSLVLMNFLQFIIDNNLGINWLKHK